MFNYDPLLGAFFTIVSCNTYDLMFSIVTSRSIFVSVPIYAIGLVVVEVGTQFMIDERSGF